MGLGGWQWLFIVEGVPSVLVGLWALRHLTDKPIEAAWLEPDERIALQARIDHERKSREAIRHYKLGEALTSPRVLGLSLVCAACRQRRTARTPARPAAVLDQPVPIEHG